MNNILVKMNNILVKMNDIVTIFWNALADLLIRLHMAVEAVEEEV